MRNVQFIMACIVACQMVQARAACDHIGGRLLVEDRRDLSLLDVHLDFPLWSKDTFSTVRSTAEGPVLDFAPNASARIQVGYTGADAEHFVAESLRVRDAISYVSHLRAQAEFHIVFRRARRRFQLGKCDALPANLTQAVLIIRLAGDPPPGMSNNSRAMGSFLRQFGRSDLLDVPDFQLDFAAAVLADGDSLHGQRAVLIDGVEAPFGPMGDKCAGVTYIVKVQPVLSTDIPQFLLTSGDMSNWHQIPQQHVLSVNFHSSPFPSVGHFTKAELESRKTVFVLFFGVCTFALVVVGTLAAAKKTNRWCFAVTEVTDSHEYDTLIQGGVGSREESQLSSKGLDARQSDVDKGEVVPGNENLGGLRARLRVNDVEPSDDQLHAVVNEVEQVRKRTVVTHRWGVISALYIAYVIACVTSPILNIQVATCYEGIPWERHVVFFMLFVLSKSWEVYSYASDPVFKSFSMEIFWGLDSFLFRFFSSFFQIF